MNRPKDVDAYIADSSPDARSKLAEIRALIKSAVPDVEEKISYGVPFYRYHGDLAGFAVYAKHISFGTASETLRQKDRVKLQKNGYAAGIKTIRIGFDQTVPRTVLTAIIRTQAKRNVAARKQDR